MACGNDVPVHRAMQPEEALASHGALDRSVNLSTASSFNDEIPSAHSLQFKTSVCGDQDALGSQSSEYQLFIDD